MERHGYNEDGDDTWSYIKWRGIIASATRGKRGQQFFRDLVAALDAMPQKRLVRGELQDTECEVCALGALGQHKHLAMDQVDTEDWEKLGQLFGVAEQLTREVMYWNDQSGQTPEQRWNIVREWAARQIVPTDGELSGATER